mgnify:CR=1 FL=1
MHKYRPAAANENDRKLPAAAARQSIEALSIFQDNIFIFDIQVLLVFPLPSDKAAAKVPPTRHGKKRPEFHTSLSSSLVDNGESCFFPEGYLLAARPALRLAYQLQT